MAAAPGTEPVVQPAAGTVGGYAAWKVVSVVREADGCDPGYLFGWDPMKIGAFWLETRVGDTMRVWIVELDERHLVLVGETSPDAGTAVVEEIEQIVNSIHFE